MGIYVFFLYLTLPAMRPFLTLLYETFGKEMLSVLVNFLMIGSAVFLSMWFFSIRGKERYLRGIQTLLLLPVTGVVVVVIETPEERIHFVEYGVLGWLVLRALSHRFPMPFLASVFFVSIVGGGDEFIQWILPNRVGDIRDVLFNTIGGLIGISMGAVWNREV